MNNITKTQIDGISAEQLFNRLDELENSIHQLSLQPTPKEEPQYLTRAQVAAKLQVTNQTLISWHKKGVLKGSRVGTRVRYLKSDVEELMNQTKGSK